MADNIAVTAGSGTTVAADEASYSGDTSKIQLVRPVHVTGSEGSKSVVEFIKAEDAAHASGDYGIMVLAVRADTPASTANADGDYAALTLDSSGRLYVNVNNTVTVTGTVAATQSGTWTVQPGNTANTTAWLVTGTGGTFPVTDSGGSLTVDAPVGTPVFVRLSDGSAAITTLPVSLASVPSHAVTNAGTFAVQVDNTVTVASHAVTNAGTFAVQVDGAALTSLQLLDDAIFADDAAFTPATSKSIAVGFIADEGSTDSVDEGDVGAARMTLDRKIHVVTELESSSLRAAGTALTPKFAIIDAATSGDNTLVAAVNPKKIRVTSLMLVAAGTVNVRFESGAGGTALSGQMNLTAQTGFTLPFNPLGWFETASNTLLNLELSAAVSVDGMLTYVEV